jgi:hypothetical protein
VAASGYPAPTFSEAGTLPNGVTLTSAGVLSGTPAAGAGGNYPITITATNGVTPDSTQSFTLSVDQAPSITSINSANFTLGVNGTFTVTASGFPAATITETGSLPVGLTLSYAGVLSGTPLVASATSFPITITAANGTGPVATQSFTVSLTIPPAAPSIVSANSTTFTVGSAGTFTAYATGYPVPTFSEAGTLPNGVTFQSSTEDTLDSSYVVLSGTPSAGTGGSYPITITATNGVGAPATQSFTLTVRTVFQITTTSLPNALVGTPYSQSLTTAGGGSSIVWTAVSLPIGFKLSSSGVLTGKPSSKALGPLSVDVSASSDLGTPVTASIPLTVDGPPVFGKKSPTKAYFIEGIGRMATTLSASGYPAPAFSETGNLPSGVTLDPATGVLSGTPPITVNTEVYDITVTAANGISPSASEAFALWVVAPLAITTSSLPGATRGIAIAEGDPAYQLHTTGGVGKVVWKKSGPWPAGLHLESSGFVYGTPSTLLSPGLHTLGVEAVDQLPLGTLTTGMAVTLQIS